MLIEVSKRFIKKEKKLTIREHPVLLKFKPVIPI